MSYRMNCGTGGGVAVKTGPAARATPTIAVHRSAARPDLVPSRLPPLGSRAAPRLASAPEKTRRFTITYAFRCIGCRADGEKQDACRRPRQSRTNRGQVVLRGGAAVFLTFTLG